MAASVLAAGGSVLLASKNHQALDAVEDRLGSLAPDVPFTVRTINPNDETDTGFSDALRKLLENESRSRATSVDELALGKLIDTAHRRTDAVDAIDRITELECEISDVLERIDLHEAHGRDEVTPTQAREASTGILRRLIFWFRSVFTDRTVRREASIPDNLERRGMSLADLRRTLATLRSMRERLGDPEDPIELGERIREATGQLLPVILSARSHLSEDERRELCEIYDDWAFNGGKVHPPSDLSKALMGHRPLWLASILGTPRRIPLDDGLFDLVIFDEASQCDIATAIPLLPERNGRLWWATTGSSLSFPSSAKPRIAT
jgi:hypothetical protein